MLGNLDGLGRSELRAVWQNHERQAGRVAGFTGDERARLRGGFHVEKVVRNLIARQEVAKAVTLSRPAVAYDANASVPGAKGGTPLVEHVVEDGVEFFFRRIPRLQEVVVHSRLVDGSDGRLGIGISREQRAFAFGVILHGLRQEGHPVHFRHALVR